MGEPLTATEAMARQENAEMRRMLERQLILSIIRGCDGDVDAAEKLQTYLSEQRVLIAEVAIGVVSATRAPTPLITEDP